MRLFFLALAADALSLHAKDPTPGTLWHSIDMKLGDSLAAMRRRVLESDPEIWLTKKTEPDQ
jgi:hypothetical protein